MPETPNDTNTSRNDTSGQDYPDQVIQGHKYDGIREYDNPMPGWWIALFWVCVVFAVLYVPGVHFFDYIDTYEEDLAENLEALEAIRTAHAEANPTFVVDEATLERYVEDPSMIQAGAVNYQGVCAACHGAEGQGGIGPNLTDNYWIYENTNVAIYDIITNGLLDKGMPAWEAVLSPEERAQVVAYVQSLVGTNPPNPKEPQGDLIE